MIKELFLATIISTSISVRTPNDEEKPLDYEFAIKAEKSEGNFTWAFKKDWERELGEKYEDIACRIWGWFIMGNYMLKTLVVNAPFRSKYKRIHI